MGSAKSLLERKGPKFTPEESLCDDDVSPVAVDPLARGLCAATAEFRNLRLGAGRNTAESPHDKRLRVARIEISRSTSF